MLSEGTGRIKKWTRRTAAVLAFAILAVLALPPREAHAEIASLYLKSPQDIKFHTYNGVTEMYIADTGNNRVIRADTDGLANLIIPVNNPTAITIDEDGNLFVAESGLAANLHAFNRDGEPLLLPKYNSTESVSIIELTSRFTNPTIGMPQLLNIKSLAITKSTDTVTHEQFKVAQFICERYGVTSFFPTTYGLITEACNVYLNQMGWGSGSGGGGVDAETGYALHPDGRLWRSGGYYVDLESTFNMSFDDINDQSGEIAVDPVDEMFYVVMNKTKIDRTSYTGASYYNRPTLQPWLNLTEDYGISSPHSIFVGPDRALYVTDAAQDRIIVVNLDATGSFNRVLELTHELNDPPTAGSFAKRGKMGQTVSFEGSDFLNRYSDPNGHAMASIRVVTLPAHGTFNLTGVPVQAGQVIPVASLNGLTFTPDPLWGGTTAFEWLAKDDRGAYSATAGTAEIFIRIPGDANGDGVVTPADALLITKYLKGKITLTADQLEALDMDEDGEITEADATLIMNIYMGNAV
ncbi:dockerin type I domain-containing protein [Cohnella boryungensis]|uniref:Dockerin type I domain-containing protein n=1 Tax=Cohnella boryungensis TaxID=768479 RepID=A0ABV8S481_9BACL